MIEKRAFSLEIVKAAFWRTFHKHGEVWFNYLDDDETNEESTEQHWRDFNDNLMKLQAGDVELMGALGQSKIPEVLIPIKTIAIPDRGDGPAKPVRAYVDGDVLIQEFEIVSGPRKGTILTLKTRMQP